MLDFEKNYASWRDNKLQNAAHQDALSVFSIRDPESLSSAELHSLREHCADNNFAIYSLSNASKADKSSIESLTKQLGMQRLDHNLCADNDSITSLKVMDLGRAIGYIPYSSKALNWHTDGYYNSLSHHIRSFLLHCLQKAPTGGENIFINHELIYIHLFDENPDFIHALSQKDALTIPENIENGVEIRPAQSGPVFYRDNLTHALQMRYTARSRSIHWKQDKVLLKAVSMIEELLSANKYVLNYTLQPGEGFICNNILHGRTAFTNGNIPEQQRLLYRARSYNRLFSQ